MKLTTTALEKMNHKRVLSTLALALDKSEMTIRRYMSDNKDNGPLTTVQALKVIRKETGLSQSQILEDIKQSIAA